MSDFDPEQAKQRLRELDDLRNRQIDENPFLLHKLRRGDYDFHVDADWDIRELQKDARQATAPLSTWIWILKRCRSTTSVAR